MSIMNKECLAKDLEMIFFINDESAKGFIEITCRKCEAAIKYSYISSVNRFCIIKFQNTHNHDISRYLVDDSTKTAIQKQIFNFKSTKTEE